MPGTPAPRQRAQQPSKPPPARHVPQRGTWEGRRAYILDGTTVRLAPSLPLRVAFPPASNQHGQSHGPILHLVVGHELQSGLAVRSEPSLARGLLARLPNRSIILADRNFGVFIFTWAAVAAKHDVLLRLTGPRFGSLRKKAWPLGAGKWEVSWQPRRADHKAHPELPAEAMVKGWLHEVKVSEKLTVWLFTTLEATGPSLPDEPFLRRDRAISARAEKTRPGPECAPVPDDRITHRSITTVPSISYSRRRVSRQHRLRL